jgi:cell division protein FtsW (lipid II flippase)
MQSYNKHIEEFLQLVCNEIKCKSVHKNVARELENHIEDQKTEYVNKGLDQETALKKAIKEMGNPVSVGKELDKTHRPKTEWSILVLASVLVILSGTIQFLFSGISQDNYYMFSHFLLYAPIGIAAFLFVYFFDYTLFSTYPKLIFSGIFIITVLIYVFSNKPYGGFIYMYYAVLLFIPAFAGIVYSLKDKGYLGIIISGLFYLSGAFLCLISPSEISLLLLTISVFTIITTSIAKGFFKVNKKIGLAIVYVPTLLSFIILTINLHESIKKIFMIYFYPESDPKGYGFLPLMIRNAFSQARLIGSSLNENTIIPLWNTDFTLTYIVARWGYVAGIAITSLMVALIIRMFIVVSKQKNSYSFLLSLSCTIAITSQIILYTLSNVSIINIRITLPFISFGAYSFITNMILLGLLLSIYRRSHLISDRFKGTQHKKPVLSFENGKLTIDFGLLKPKKLQ